MSLYGIPPLAPGNLANFALGGVIALVQDAFLPAAASPVWGILDVTWNPLIVPDTIISFEYRNEWRVSDYPQEDGAFASYNKINTPYDIRIRMAKGGKESEVTNFIDSIEAAAGTTDLYNIATPNRSYSDLTIEHFDYKRESGSGVGMVTVDLWLREVRIAEPAQFSGALPAKQVKSTSSADPVSQGQVQTYSVAIPNVTVTTL